MIKPDTLLKPERVLFVFRDLVQTPVDGIMSIISSIRSASRAF